MDREKEECRLREGGMQIERKRNVDRETDEQIGRGKGQTNRQKRRKNI